MPNGFPLLAAIIDEADVNMFGATGYFEKIPPPLETAEQFVVDWWFSGVDSAGDGADIAFNTNYKYNFVVKIQNSNNSNCKEFYKNVCAKVLNRHIDNFNFSMICLIIL